MAGIPPVPPLRQPTTGPMSASRLQAVIDDAWERRTEIGTGTKGEVRDAVEAALEGLDNGSLRVATQKGDHLWPTFLIFEERDSFT